LLGEFAPVHVVEFVFTMAIKPRCLPLSRANARAKWILRIEHQLRFRIHKG
jgi:hypothetical protein